MVPMSAPLDVSDPLFTAIDHVGIAVPDLDEAIDFYTKTFGMRVAHEETNEEPSTSWSCGCCIVDYGANDWTMTS
jgi:catechol 2,3-dioxygenase-like lactoylglutathione lyase family enzyme